MLNPLKKTKNAWSLIFFNRQVLSANELFKLFSFYDLFEWFQIKELFKACL